MRTLKQIKDAAQDLVLKGEDLNYSSKIERELIYAYADVLTGMRDQVPYSMIGDYINHCQDVSWYN